MSNDKKVYTHELAVRFECDETNLVNWEISTDHAVDNTLGASYEDLAGAGVPLSALGIRVLRDLLATGLLELALDKANNHIWRKYFERHAEVCGVAYNDAAEQWLASHDDLGPLQ
jgi:hypothetical protein